MQPSRLSPKKPLRAKDRSKSEPPDRLLLVEVVPWQRPAAQGWTLRGNTESPAHALPIPREGTPKLFRTHLAAMAAVRVRAYLFPYSSSVRRPSSSVGHINTTFRVRTS